MVEGDVLGMHETCVSQNAVPTSWQATEHAVYIYVCDNRVVCVVQRHRGQNGTLGQNGPPPM